MKRTGLLGSVLLAGCTGADGDAEQTETPTRTASPAPTPTATPSPSVFPEADQVVDMGPGGALRFDPESFRINVGDTVVWVFKSEGHNVKVDSAPDGATWAGTPGDEFDTIGVGEIHEHTFEVPGGYDYSCAPHQSAGMTGSFTVEE